jgi:hypothetical protein
MNAAETYGDPDLLILGHLAATNAHFWLGDPIKSREHADRVLALYSEERHGHLVGNLNQDPKTFSLRFSAQSTWILGYPEQAPRISDAKDAHARRRWHPFDLGWALTVGVEVFDYLRELDEMVKRIVPNRAPPAAALEPVAARRPRAALLSLRGACGDRRPWRRRSP